MLLLFAVILAFGRVSIVVGGGQVETRLDLLGHAFVRRVVAERLRLERDTDSDSRNRYELIAIGEGRRLPLASRRYTRDPILSLGEWLAARLAVPLDVDEDFPARTSRKPPEPTLAELRAALEHRRAKP